MKLYATYGFLITLVGALLALTMFSLGYHSTNFAVSQHPAWLLVVMAIAGTGIALGMRDYRKEIGDGVMSYGRGLGTGVLITLWSTAFSLVFNIVYLKFINPGYSEAMFQFQMAEAERKGMPAAQIDQAEGILRAISSTVGITVGGVVVGLLIGVVLSLILAAIFKSKPGQSAPPPVAA
jgi:hypothetical protein